MEVKIPDKIAKRSKSHCPSEAGARNGVEAKDC